MKNPIITRCKQKLRYDEHSVVTANAECLVAHANMIIMPALSSAHQYFRVT